MAQKDNRSQASASASDNSGLPIKLERKQGSNRLKELTPDQRSKVVDELGLAHERGDTLEAFAKRVFGLTIENAGDDAAEMTQAAIGQSYRWVLKSVRKGAPKSEAALLMPQNPPRLSSTTGASSGGARSVILPADQSLALAARFIKKS